MKICVFASSSEKIDKIYFKKTNELATKMAQNGHALVYGAGRVGLMGELSRVYDSFKGEIIGVIPEKLNKKGIVFESCTELIVTKDMRERKHVLDMKSDAVITLAGGFGTLEEISEVIVAKQLGYINKPLVIMNTNSFYDLLKEMFERYISEKFAITEMRQMYLFTEDVDEAIEYIENYKPVVVSDKYILK